VPDDESEVEWPAEGLPEVEDLEETPHDDIMKRLLDYQRSLREGASPEEAAEVMRRGVSADPALLEASAAAEGLADSLAAETETPQGEIPPEPEPEAAESEVAAPEAAEPEAGAPQVDEEVAEHGDWGEALIEAPGTEVVEPPSEVIESEPAAELPGFEREATVAESSPEESEIPVWDAPAAETAEPSTAEFEVAPSESGALIEETVEDESARGDSIAEPEPESPVEEMLEPTTQAADVASAPSTASIPEREFEARVGGLEDKLEGLAQRIAELRRSFQQMAVAADDRLASLAEEVERAKHQQEQEQEHEE
jgi:hypothetical protein